MPSSKSASAKPVGSCTPFSLEHASQRFTFCILPSRICVRKTVASLHLQTSQSIAEQLDHKSAQRFNRPCFAGALSNRFRRVLDHSEKIGVPVSRVNSRKRAMIRVV